MGNKDPKAHLLSARKKILYALIPLVLVLIAATQLLDFLDREEVIRVERGDDRVSTAPVGFIRTIQTETGAMYQIQDPNEKDPLILPATFPVAKMKNEFRIISVGASFAQGDPYVDPAMPSLGYGGIPDWASRMLKGMYPSKEIRWINAAMGGTNSSGVRQIFEQVVVTKPDAILVMTGNNEGFVPKTPFNEPLQKWIVYRALKKAILDNPEMDNRPYFPLQDQDNRQIETVYRANIEKMIKLAEENNVPLILATLPINLKFNGEIPNSQELALAIPANDQNLSRGIELLEKCDFDAAIDTLSQSENQAFAVYYIATAFEAKGEYKKALQFYRVWVERNPLGRMRPSFNDFIRSKKDTTGITVVDLDESLQKASRTGLPGQDMFLDNCHLRWDWYHHLSIRIAQTIQEADLIAAADGEPKLMPNLLQIVQENSWQGIFTYKPRVWGQEPPPENQLPPVQGM